MDTSALAYTHEGAPVVIGSRCPDRGTLPEHTTASICTYTGKEFWPLDPRIADIDIIDIAHALSQIVRYTGHVSHPWTVGLHSLEVSRRVEAAVLAMSLPPLAAPDQVVMSRLLGLVGLLHDASEAYLVDVPRPLKPYFTGYAENEERLERAIAVRFGLPYPHPPLVKQIDSDILLDEVANFFSPGSFIWRRYNITKREAHPRLLTLDAQATEQRFLARFRELSGSGRDF